MGKKIKEVEKRLASAQIENSLLNSENATRIQAELDGLLERQEAYCIFVLELWN